MTASSQALPVKYAPFPEIEVGENGSWLKNAFSPFDRPDTYEDIIEFHGPPAAYCMGVIYDRLTHAGVVREGCATPGPKIWSLPEALDLFKAQLREFCADAQQIAWRQHPVANQSPSDNSWTVSCRLARWPATQAKESNA